jgi:peptidoglycan hydrolase CwlO-like protein
MVGLTLVSAITSTVVVAPGPVAADQVSNLKAQAAQIARALVLEQLQIGSYQQQYDVDVARVQQDEAKIAASQNRIHADVNRVGRDHDRLVNETVAAYINSGAEPDGTPALFEGNQSVELARGQYEQVANGDITLAIDALRTDENELRAQRVTLDQQEAQDQVTTNQESAAANGARQTEGQLQSKQSEITGELATAVAQQQAAQAAAAAAAVRAAQAAANRTKASTTPTALSASSASTAAQGSVAGTPAGDPSLPPFLQCVLRVESGGDYQAVSPGGSYMGGFQFSQPTWNEAAQLAGMPQLVGVPPDQATRAQQDDLAIALYHADGEQPWNDSCQHG